jgi:hypothetical protein
MSARDRVYEGTEQGGPEIRLVIYIREVPNSNLDRHTGYRD